MAAYEELVGALIYQSAVLAILKRVGMAAAAQVENLRYSRFGNLRYRGTSAVAGLLNTAMDIATVLFGFAAWLGLTLRDF